MCLGALLEAFHKIIMYIAQWNPLIGTNCINWLKNPNLQLSNKQKIEIDLESKNRQDKLTIDQLES